MGGGGGGEGGGGGGYSGIPIHLKTNVFSTYRSNSSKIPQFRQP